MAATSTNCFGINDTLLYSNISFLNSIKTKYIKGVENKNEIFILWRKLIGVA